MAATLGRLVLGTQLLRVLTLLAKPSNVRHVRSRRVSSAENGRITVALHKKRAGDVLVIGVPTEGLVWSIRQVPASAARMAEYGESERRELRVALGKEKETDTNGQGVRKVLTGLATVRVTCK